MPKMVMVRQKEKKKKTAGGLVLSAQTEPATTGEIVQLGIRNENHLGNEIPWDVEIGNRICWNKHHGRTIDFHGETMLLLYESEIIGIIS